MFTLAIGLAERYPLFVLDSRHGGTVNVDAGTAQRWRRVMAEFEVVQAEIDAELRKVPGHTTSDGLWRI